jgi:hypothetical protein
VGCRAECYYSKDPLNPIKLVATDVSHSFCQDETNLKKLLNGDFAIGCDDLFNEINFADQATTLSTATYRYCDLTTHNEQQQAIVGRVTNCGSEGQQFQCIKIQILLNVTWQQPGAEDRVETFEDGEQIVCIVKTLPVELSAESTHIDLGEFVQHMIPVDRSPGIDQEGDF